MKILLTGSTGFLGFRTLERLVKHPELEVIIANGRTIKSTHVIHDPKIRYQLGDLRDVKTADNLTNGMDCIVHAAALSSPWGNTKDFIEANLTTQQNLIQAAKKFNIRRYVYISTPSIYFNSKDRLAIKETDPLPEKFINAYASTKRAAEIELINSGIPYIILRPRALIGRGDTVIMPRVIKAYEQGRLKIIGTGENLVDLTSVSNAALAIELSIFAESKAINQDYNISNGQPVLLWQTINKMLGLLGHSLSQQKLSYFLVKRIASVLEWKSRITNNNEPVLTTYGVGTLAKSFTLDISKSRSLLNYSPTFSTDEAIEEFADWYLPQM